MDTYHLRGILLRLQDRLSNEDRRRLHFFLGDDIPQRVRDDPTLIGTLSLMESLFDQEKINAEDFTFLIDAFEAIYCRDAAQLLRNYRDDLQENVKVSLTSTLKKVFSASALLFRRHSPFLLVLVSIGLMLSVVFLLLINDQRVQWREHCLEKEKLIVQQRWRLSNNEKQIELLRNQQKRSRLRMNNEEMEKLKKQCKELEEQQMMLPMKIGHRFGVDDGVPFSDSSATNLSISHYLSGVTIYLEEDNRTFSSLRFFYSSSTMTNNDERIQSPIHGNSGCETPSAFHFHLDADERISHVQLRIAHDVVASPAKTQLRRVLIKGIRFSTNLARGMTEFDAIDEDEEIVDEQFDGYTIGYATGRSDRHLHQLQFYWYRTTNLRSP